jgi:hypothetical protein
MRLVDKSQKSTILFLYLVAFGLLWLGYASFIVPVFAYSGFEWSPNRIKVLESLLVIFFFVWCLPSAIRRPSDCFVHIHFLLPVLPMLVLYGAADYAREYMYFVILAFAIVCMIRKLHIPKIKGDIVPTSIMMWGSLLVVAIYILGVFLQGGSTYFNLDLRRVYEFRMAAAENLPRYLTNIVSNILIPFILILAVSRRKLLIACLAILGSVMIFGLSSHKSMLFYPFFALAIYQIIRSNIRFIPLFLISYIAIMLITLFPFFINQIASTERSPVSILLGSLGFRRGYFTPSFINFGYYEFFSTHPHTTWAESKLTFGLVDYPYNVSATHLMGYHLFDNVKTGANTAWLGSGYMHLGVAGLLLYAFIIGLLFAIVDMLAKGRDFGIITAMLFIPFLALFINSDLPTVMLTHGLLFSFFITWICQLKTKHIPPNISF